MRFKSNLNYDWDSTTDWESRSTVEILNRQLRIPIDGRDFFHSQSTVENLNRRLRFFLKISNLNRRLTFSIDGWESQSTLNCRSTVDWDFAKLKPKIMISIDGWDFLEPGLISFWLLLFALSILNRSTDFGLKNIFRFVYFFFLSGGWSGFLILLTDMIFH